MRGSHFCELREALICLSPFGIFGNLCEDCCFLVNSEYESVFLTALFRFCRFLSPYTHSRRLKSFLPMSIWVESLEDRTLLASAFPEFVDPNPNPGNDFGHSVVALATGNVVVTSPGDDARGTDSGAVYLFDGSNGALISTLTGSSDNNSVGGDVIALPNGNFVVTSPGWDNGDATNAGAVTFGNGITGISGVVSAENSLVGSTEGDEVGGIRTGVPSVTILENGNYVVTSPLWSDGTEKLGAVTFGSGDSGVSGPVSSSNSLVGTSTISGVGSRGVTALANGNYVVASSGSSAEGAVTFGNGTTGVIGPVSSSNSLVGTRFLDNVGKHGVIALTNGNYVVVSPEWNNPDVVDGGDAGAVTFGNGTSGVSGTISSSNSLVGTSRWDYVGQRGVTALSNGNYVIASPSWSGNTGAVTFGNGTTGISGTIDSSNSLIGASPGDKVGHENVTALANGDYVAISPAWSNGKGAVTFGDGTSGVTGLVTTSNSLVGTTEGDAVGSSGVTALTNGNYVVSSPLWKNGNVTNAGAVTFVDATSGVSGPVSISNSLVGTTEDDRVGRVGLRFGGAVTALTNGNYVVASSYWNNGSAIEAGAVTFGDGTSGVSGPVNTSNSLVGTTAHDNVGFAGVTALTNGNYVVSSPFWNNSGVETAGAVTFGNGMSGITGPVSSSNSLVGTTDRDQVGRVPPEVVQVVALSNGNYVVGSPLWDDEGIVNAGAATFGNGTSGVSGPITSSNSLVGTSADDFVGREIKALSNGNYVVASASWSNGNIVNAGAVTLGSGVSGVSGPVNDRNSLVGTTDISNLRSVVVDDVNDTFFARFLFEAVGGRIRVWPNSPVACLSITADASRQEEGTTGMTALTFTVTRTFETAGEITVNFEIIATNGLDADDFGGTLPDGIVTFADGDTEETITVQISGDTTVEADELLTVMLSNPSGDAVIGTKTASSIITNDEKYLLTAAGQGGGPHVIGRHAATGEPLFDFFAYHNSFTGGVRVATGDINGDGAGDIITAAGVGGGPHIKVFDGLTGEEMISPVGSFFAYDSGFTGGVFIATGDINDDGFDDVITAAGAGGGPHVKVFSGMNGNFLASFLAYDPRFVGGVSVATGDINSDGMLDIVTGPGVGGGPHVRAFSGDDLSEVASFFAYDVGFTGGVNVATGQLNPREDNNADIITSPSAGGGPHIRAFSGSDQSELLSFFAYEMGFVGGVLIATVDLNEDGVSDIVTAPGSGGAPDIFAFDGSNSINVLANFFAFDDRFTGGVFVAGTTTLELTLVTTSIAPHSTQNSRAAGENQPNSKNDTPSDYVAPKPRESLTALDNEFGDEQLLVELLSI